MSRRNNRSRNNFNRSGDDKCFNCGQSGHKSYNCPNKVVCHNCKKPGHKSFECPLKKKNKSRNTSSKSINSTNQNQKRNSGSQNNQNRNNKLNNSTSNNSSNNNNNNNNNSNRNKFNNNNTNNQSGLICYNCKKPGHKSFECPLKKNNNNNNNNYDNKTSNNNSNNNNNGDDVCYNCRQKGHKSFECPQKNNRYKNKRQNINYILPKWWTKIENKPEPYAGYDLVSENNNNREILKKAKDEYLRTMKNGDKILNMWIVQNQFFWEQHKAIEKGWIEHRFKDEPQKLNIRWLFHGSARDIIKKEILSNDFNRIYNTVHAYGKGVYFAKDSKYSMSGYAKKDNNGHKWLLLCRVLCGESCRGTSSMMEPNKKPNSNIRYETMVDRLPKPTIYVTPKDKQAYPFVLFQIKA